MLGFWTLTLSRPQSAAVTPSGNSTSYLPICPRSLSLACRIVSVTGLLPTVLPTGVYRLNASLAPERAAGRDALDEREARDRGSLLGGVFRSEIQRGR